MCTTCGCGAGETRIEGQVVPPEHAGDPHWHVHADGTGHSHDHANDGHAHEHGNEHAHAHTHPHRHADGSVHSHPHDHGGEHHHHHHAAHHEHEHVHADGTVHVHGHTHDDTGFHDHPQAHDHVHAAGFGMAAHAAQHQHLHEHADGSVHSHSHDHSGEHQHHHHSVEHQHQHRHADGTVHSHGHAHADAHLHEHPQAHEHSHAGVATAAGTLDYGSGPARSHAPGMTQARMVQIERDILSKNDGYADQNRQLLADRGIFALNFVSSPGSGKTTLLVRTIEALKAKHAIAVIEGDQQTANDADRIRATGAPALQINTGKGCHLDAHMVGQALAKMPLADASLLFIENVGNLVCPAAFDLGEAAKVAILSVTEGEDKPLKYPDMFAAAKLMLLNKVDLLPHLSFKVEEAIAAARRVNPQLEILQVSATSGEGFEAWLAWLEAGLTRTRQARDDSNAALRARIAQLEAQLAARG